MVWFYKRGGVSLSVETRYDNETKEYVAVVVRPDGRQQTERFRAREAFREWLHTQRVLKLLEVELDGAIDALQHRAESFGSQIAWQLLSKSLVTSRIEDCDRSAHSARSIRLDLPMMPTIGVPSPAKIVGPPPLPPTESDARLPPPPQAATQSVAASRRVARRATGTPRV
jgi:hypothetical protein